jgi:hypothetical protein
VYALYQKHPTGGGHRYQFAERVHLFGCNNGYIPWLLSESLSEAASEPLRWHLCIGDALKAVDQEDSTLIINLKPNAKSPNLSLYEVIEVFGYSASGWTPVMLHLGGLFVDEDPSQFDEMDFGRVPGEVDDPIFSMMYLKGTVRGKELQGPWTTPGPSSTNSVLLWPSVFEYFSRAASAIIERTG